MDWLREHPEVKTIRMAAADLNGQPRGKRMPARFADKILTEGTKFPFSVLNMDIWGEDIEDSPLVFQAGDPDGLLLPTERGFMPMPWLEAPTGLLPLWMFHTDGRPPQSFASGLLPSDGHPSFAGNGSWLVTDTLPKGPESARELLIVNVASHEVLNLGSYRSAAPFRGDVRCDLHPRWNRDGRSISFDGSHESRRMIYIIDLP